MKYVIFAFFAVITVTVMTAAPAQAQNNFSHDAAGCDLSQRTRLSDLCPNGFGLPTYGSTQEIMDRNPNIAKMIIDAAKEYGVDPKVALAVSAHEGAMSACAGSFSGVRGPMQLTEKTAKGYGMDRNILSDNIRGGMATLRDAIRRCDGTQSIRCIANIYNGSTESQRRNWTNDVTNRLASLNNAQMPQGCKGGQKGGGECPSGPGDFPTAPPPGTPAAALSA